MSLRSEVSPIAESVSNPRSFVTSSQLVPPTRKETLRWHTWSISTGSLPSGALVSGDAADGTSGDAGGACSDAGCDGSSKGESRAMVERIDRVTEGKYV